MLTPHLLHNQPTNHIPKHQSPSRIQMRIIDRHQIVQQCIILPDPVQVRHGGEIQVDHECAAGAEGRGYGEDGEALGKQVFSGETGGVVVAAGERGDENGVAARGPDGEGEVMDVSGEFLDGDGVFIVVAELGLWLAFPCAIGDLRLRIERVG